MLEPNASYDLDEPQTLRSDLPPYGILVARSPDTNSTSSVGSYSLQISRSHSGDLVTGKQQNQSKVNGGLKSQPSPTGSDPSDASDLSCAVNQTAAASNTLGETESARKAKEHKGVPPAEDIGDYPCPPELSNNGAVCHARSAHVGTILPSPTGNLAVFSVSDLPPSRSDLPPTVSHLPPSRSDLLPSVSNLSSSVSDLPPALSGILPSVSDLSPSGHDLPPPSSVLPSIPSSVKFFSFVILHVQEDEEEAQRMCDILKKLIIGNGTTFCEGFEIAGRSPLTCLEDAVENSAYIVLLLTDRFQSKWGQFQTCAVLMNSIQDLNKCGTVIPLIPRFNSIILRDLPLHLRALTRLEESSTAFETRVKKTFKENVIKTQREEWERDQAIKASQKRLEDAERLSNALVEI
ncbi:uncharacterized protein ACNLHF_028238 isoform 1-T2 [Anomaloglossus baeobatrachus]|uniref:uncharacterized protein LOC142249192 n=1 Tax=Anomaloglossus baeobatrachus TaxID=238106 RepID=UPI003F4F575D